jgi:hypothetical protein
MAVVEILNIEEAGPDYLRLRGGNTDVRINFADDEMFSKEESAATFRHLLGKPAAIPVGEPFFIGVDFWRDRFDGSLKVVPFNFTVASVDRGEAVPTRSFTYEAMKENSQRNRTLRLSAAKS